MWATAAAARQRLPRQFVQQLMVFMSEGSRRAMQGGALGARRAAGPSHRRGVRQCVAPAVSSPASRSSRERLPPCRGMRARPRTARASVQPHCTTELAKVQIDPAVLEGMRNVLWAEGFGAAAPRALPEVAYALGCTPATRRRSDWSRTSGKPGGAQARSAAQRPKTNRSSAIGMRQGRGTSNAFLFECQGRWFALLRAAGELRPVTIRAGDSS